MTCNFIFDIKILLGLSAYKYGMKVMTLIFDSR